MTTFTNRLGQTLNPGDRVVVIAQGYSHSIRERQGTFVGVSASGTPQVRVQSEASTWRHSDGTISRKWQPGCDYAGKVATEFVRTYFAGRVYRLG